MRSFPTSTLRDVPLDIYIFRFQHTASLYSLRLPIATGKAAKLLRITSRRGYFRKSRPQFRQKHLEVPGTCTFVADIKLSFNDVCGGYGRSGSDRCV